MVWEELARYGAGFAATLLPGAAAHQLIGLFAADNKELVDRYVYPYCDDTTGRKISAWGSSEPEVGSDGSNYEDRSVRHHTSAVKKGDRWILNGTKSDFVSNGGIADVYLVFACVDPEDGLKGSGAFVVPGDAPGLSRGTAVDKIGLRTLNQAPVFFDEVEIPEAYMIFPPGDGYPMLHNSIITVGNLGVGYLAVGLMRAAYEEALRLRQGARAVGPAHRRAPAGHGETVRGVHRHRDRARLPVEGQLAGQDATSRATSRPAWRPRSTPPAAPFRHTAEMVQVLGGYGITKDYKVEKYARDATLLPIMDGTNETLMIKAAKLL